MPDFPILSTVLFMPLVGVVIILALKNAEAIKWTALIVASVTFLTSLTLYFGFENRLGMQFVEHQPWIDLWGVKYALGIDGISLFMVLLTTFLSIPTIVGTWQQAQPHTREFMICLLLLMVGTNGVFMAQDMFLFFLFWEVMLFPMYFLIGVWGSERRLYAAIKFVIYTMISSAFMLIALVYLAYMHYEHSGAFSFLIEDWYGLTIGAGAQFWLFLAFALAFAVKVPMFPFHTWLPDAHVEAPTAGSVILAGVLLKMGSYGFIRIALPMFTDAVDIFWPWLVGLSIIGVLYGALVCMVQKDMKKLVAYSSVAHMGFVMLGIFSLDEIGMSGAVLQMVNHGISTGALFLLVGMLYERRHTKIIAEYGGIAKTMPVFTVISVIVVLSSIGLPGLNGFVGEYLILLGFYNQSPVWAIITTSGVIFAAVYLLWMVERVYFGQLNNPANEKLNDLSKREFFALLPLVIMAVWIGVYPQMFLDKIKPSAKYVLSINNDAAPEQAYYSLTTEAK